MQGWGWLVLGLVLVVVEVITLRFFILWFAVGALLVGLLVEAWPGWFLTCEVLVWAVSSCLMSAVWFWINKRERLQGQGAASVVLGQFGVLTASVAESQRGRVRFQQPLLGRKEWVCSSDQFIASGARVRLVAVEGNTVRVEKM